MSEMSYIGVIDRYHLHKEEIQDILSSILTGIAEQRLFANANSQNDAIRCLGERYPFVDLLYTLDSNGKQLSDNLAPAHRNYDRGGVGKDRSQRPYYLLVKQESKVAVTEPYLSTASRSLCISAIAPVRDNEGQTMGYIVLDIGLAKTVEFLMGDSLRRRFGPLFKLVYTFITLGLFSVVGLLLYASFTELSQFFSERSNADELIYLKPFGIIIYLTLGLAIFDLAKTILEEEVLMHKDIFQHSSTRRTITRFIAAILIAVSIEALLLMFKSALSSGEDMLNAVWMMLSAVGLLVGLGIYVYLGSKAEAMLSDLSK